MGLKKSGQHATDIGSQSPGRDGQTDQKNPLQPDGCSRKNRNCWRCEQIEKLGFIRVLLEEFPRESFSKRWSVSLLSRFFVLNRFALIKCTLTPPRLSPNHTRSSNVSAVLFPRSQPPFKMDLERQKLFKPSLRSPSFTIKCSFRSSSGKRTLAAHPKPMFFCRKSFIAAEIRSTCDSCPMGRMRKKYRKTILTIIQEEIPISTVVEGLQYPHVKRGQS